MLTNPKWAKGQWAVSADGCSVVVTDKDGHVWSILLADPLMPVGNEWADANLALAATAPRMYAELELAAMVYRSMGEPALGGWDWVRMANRVDKLLAAARGDAPQG